MNLRVPWNASINMTGIPKGVMLVGKFEKPTFEEFKRDCIFHFEDDFLIDARKFVLSYELSNGRVVTYCYTLNASECFTAFMHEVKPEDYYAPIYEKAYEKVLTEIDKLNEEENNMPYRNQTSALNLNDARLYYSNATTTSTTASGFNSIKISHIPTLSFEDLCCGTKRESQSKKNSFKVSKVETYNDRVVKVTFNDGTFTKSVCSENDHFDLDVGITICIMKKMLGPNGTRVYNDMIRNVHNIMDRNEKKKAEEQAKKQEEKAKKRKESLRKAAKKVKKRQEQIDIQKTAFVEAMREIKNSELGDDLK